MGLNKKKYWNFSEMAKNLHFSNTHEGLRGEPSGLCWGSTRKGEPDLHPHPSRLVCEPKDCECRIRLRFPISTIPYFEKMKNRAATNTVPTRDEVLKPVLCLQAP